MSLFLSLAQYILWLVATYAVIRYFFPYVHVMRVPLLCGLAFVAFPYLRNVDGIKAFVGGMFEVTRWDVFQITLAVMMTAAALLTCTDIFVSYSQERLPDIPPLPTYLDRELISWPIRLSRLSAALGAIYFAGAIYHIASLRPKDGWSAGEFGEIALGLALFAVVLGTVWMMAGNRTLEEFVRGGVRTLATDAGYIEHGRVYRSHVIAFVLSALAAVSYLSFGFVRYRTIAVNEPITLAAAEAGTTVPTLAWVVFLILVACWLFSGLTFWMDARRIPVVIPLTVLIILCTTFFPRADHTFPVSTDRKVDGALAKDLLQGHDKIIVVAASGGGIQAAAWAARIVEELSKEVPDFAKHVRLVSGVSGGSVGLMYFVAAYENGDFKPAGETLFRLAKAPSLDYVAWGLAFPDFFRAWLPIAPSNIDRAWALRQAWSRYAEAPRLRGAKLAQWALDAKSHARPAVSFNATIAETGNRYLLSTFRPEQTLTGRKDISSYPEPQYDLDVVTAASLSAAFPYVSPASRPEPEAYEKAGHVVDGGYYDNFGIATAVDFLREGIPQDAKGKHIFLLHIEAGKFGERSVKEHQWGAIFQLLAPPKGLLGVWDTGMRSRNDADIALLKEVIERRGGTFASRRVDFTEEETPTSWYLTKDDIRRIYAAWDLRKDATVQAMRAFLAQN